MTLAGPGTSYGAHCMDLPVPPDCSAVRLFSLLLSSATTLLLFPTELNKCVFTLVRVLEEDQ